MQFHQLTSVEDFIFIYEHDMSVRLINVLNVYAKSLPNSPVEDITKDIFLCIPNAGKGLWKEFVHLVALMKIDEAEQKKVDEEVSKNT